MTSAPQTPPPGRTDDELAQSDIPSMLRSTLESSGQWGAVRVVPTNVQFVDVSIDGRMIQYADATGPRSAQLVLGDPGVQAAVLETARGGTLRRGLGYDWTDVGVLTNITADHLGQDGLETIEDIAHVKALVAERVRDGGGGGSHIGYFQFSAGGGPGRWIGVSAV